jgi:hypothetical protein
MGAAVRRGRRGGGQRACRTTVACLFLACATAPGTTRDRGRRAAGEARAAAGARNQQPWGSLPGAQHVRGGGRYVVLLRSRLRSQVGCREQAGTQASPSTHASSDFRLAAPATQPPSPPARPHTAPGPQHPSHWLHPFPITSPSSPLVPGATCSSCAAHTASAHRALTPTRGCQGTARALPHGRFAPLRPDWLRVCQRIVALCTLVGLPPGTICRMVWLGWHRSDGEDQVAPWCFPRDRGGET